VTRRGAQRGRRLGCFDTGRVLAGAASARDVQAADRRSAGVGRIPGGCGPMTMRWLVACCALLLALPAPGAAQTAPTNDDCLMCHGDASAVREDGRPIAVPPEVFGASVHGQLGMSCVDCHSDLATFTEFPHPEHLLPPACGTCHDAAVSTHATGVHAKARADGRAAATCADCHGQHDIRPSSDLRSRTNHFAVPNTCGTCHIVAGTPGAPAVATTFIDSIHGQGLLRRGLVVSPNCVSCHEAHDVRAATDPASRVHRSNVSGTCTTCHEGIRPVYEQGVHHQAVQAGNALAPTCAGCHTAHAVGDVATPEWQLGIIQECGTCHSEALRTYRDTFHGKVTQLGFARIAKCADCHGAHDVLPASNPLSRVSAERRVETCRACHPTANENFAQYDPHADPLDRERNPILYYTSGFMQILLGGVFLFFGAHTLLWFPRSWRARRERDARHRAGRASSDGGVA
jgi:hypothetical protein